MIGSSSKSKPYKFPGGGRLKQGSQCGAFLAAPTADLKQEKKTWDYFKKHKLVDDSEARQYTHRRIQYTSPFSWLTFWAFFRVNGDMFSIGFLLVLSVDQIAPGTIDVPIDSSTLTMLAVLLSLSIVPRFLTFTGLVKRNTVAELNREDGTVWFFKRYSKLPIIRPFSEFSGGINIGIRSRSGVSDYDLWVFHKTERLGFSLGLFSQIKESNYYEWDFIQAYMDKTKPLPDIPVLEPFRKHDLITAEWDKENERPEYLFRNMPLETYKRLEKLAYSYVQSYPWGNTRDEAVGSRIPPDKFWTLIPEEALTEEGLKKAGSSILSREVNLNESSSKRSSRKRKKKKK